MQLRWLLSRLRREPVPAWPGRLARALPRPPRTPVPAPDEAPEWPWGAGARPETPPPDPRVDGDPRAEGNRDRAQHAAFAAWTGQGAGAWPAGPPTNAHEAAFRLVSVALGAAATGDRALAAARDTLADHVVDHRSRGTSARNHAVAERAAAALAAALSPRHPRIERLRAVASELPALLEREVADGIGAEQALGYHLQNLEWGLVAWRCGVPGLDGALARGADAAVDHLAADGTLPDLGDDDGGTVFPTTLSARDRLGAVLQALRRPVPDGHQPGFVAALLDLPPLVGHRAPAARAGRDTTVLRRGPHALVLDHGPFGAPPLFGHAHADPLAVWWAPHGAWAVGGRGTRAYLGDARDRRYRRGSRSAATVTIDGRDRAEPHDAPFLWRTTVDATPGHVDLGAAVAAGRAPTAIGVHHRTVSLAADGAVVLRDTLDGHGRHHVEVTLPLRPGARVRIEADPALRPEAHPDRHGDAYGSEVPATTVRCGGVVALPCTLTTVLRPEV